MGESMAWDAIESGIDNGDGTGAYDSPTWGMDHEWEIDLYHLRKDLQRRFRKFELSLSYDHNNHVLTVTLSKAGGGTTTITMENGSGWQTDSAEYNFKVSVNGYVRLAKTTKESVGTLRSPLIRDIIKTSLYSMFDGGVIDEHEMEKRQQAEIDLESNGSNATDRYYAELGYPE